jgi:glycosyltransferase involved in cell wall biosynthesis
VETRGELEVPFQQGTTLAKQGEQVLCHEATLAGQPFAFKRGYTAPVVPVSAVVITRNEERRLGAALESAAFCDEIVVVDCASTDRTREIAEAAGASVTVNSPWPGWVAQRNLAVDKASHDWVLALDADERVSSPLREEIRALQTRGFGAAGYRIPRAAFYQGRWIRATDWYPDPQIRLFDRRHGRWQGHLVHESVVTRGPVASLRSDLEHHPYADLSDHMRKIDLYTTLWARQAHEGGRRFSVADLLIAPFWAFWRNFLIKRGFTLGLAGLTVSAMNAYYTFAKLAKLAEVERGAGSGASIQS